MFCIFRPAGGFSGQKTGANESGEFEANEKRSAQVIKCYDDVNDRFENIDMEIAKDTVLRYWIHDLDYIFF